MGKIKVTACEPIKIEIIRVIEQEQIPNGCTNRFKHWEIKIDNNQCETSYITEDRGQVLLDILHQMVR